LNLQTITLTEQHKILKAKDKHGFICRMKFRNDLPDVPFEPKLLAPATDPLTHLTQYNATVRIIPCLLAARRTSGTASAPAPAPAPAPTAAVVVLSDVLGRRC
jgi:hypothetical protein